MTEPTTFFFPDPDLRADTDLPCMTEDEITDALAAVLARSPGRTRSEEGVRMETLLAQALTARRRADPTQTTRFRPVDVDRAASRLLASGAMERRGPDFGTFATRYEQGDQPPPSP